MGDINIDSTRYEHFKQVNSFASTLASNLLTDNIFRNVNSLTLPIRQKLNPISLDVRGKCSIKLTLFQTFVSYIGLNL